MSGEPTAVGTQDPITVYRRTMRPEGRLTLRMFGPRVLNHPSMWTPWVEDGVAHVMGDGALVGVLWTPLENNSGYQFQGPFGEAPIAHSVHLCDPNGNTITMDMSGEWTWEVGE